MYCSGYQTKQKRMEKKQWRKKKCWDAGKLGRRLLALVCNIEKECGELWLRTASRSIFPCLKPQRLDNGHMAGAFRGYETGDEGSWSGEAKLRGDFPCRGLFILGVEKVSALAFCWSLEENKQITPQRSRAGATNWIRGEMECYPLYCLSLRFFCAHIKHSDHLNVYSSVSF